MSPPVAGVDGAWQCPGCSNVNFAKRDACNRCGLGKPDFETSTAQHPWSPRARPVAGVDGNWACGACGNVNFPKRDACNLCQAPKTTAYQQGRKPPPMAGVDGNWACMTCGNVNFAHREVCNRCQAPYQAPDQAPYQAPYEETTPRRGRPVAGVDGNWACGTCGNVNFAKRDVCNRCSAPKPMEMGAGYAEAAMKPQRPRPIAGVDGNWSCPACTNVNFPHRTSCNRCGLAKPDERQRGSPPVAGVNGNWACGFCNNVNFAGRSVCNRCGAAPPMQSWEAPVKSYGGRGSGPPVAGVDGNWLCMACKNVNYAIRTSCNRCGAAKPSGTNKRKGPPVAGENGNWSCQQCGNVNFASRSECNRCGEAKPLEWLEGKVEGLEAEGKAGPKKLPRKC